MRVWFSVIPGHGHFFPLLPLASALKAAGHSVVFCTSLSYGRVINDHGFDHHAVGPDYTQNSAKGDAEELEEVQQRLLKAMFEDAPPLVMDSFQSLFEREQPDVMLVDPIDGGGMIAAELAGIPWGSVVNAVRTGWLAGRLPFDLDERRSFLEDVLRTARSLRNSVGLPETDLLLNEEPYDRTFSLTMEPPSLGTWPHDWQSHTSHLLRPEIHRTPGTDETWLEDLAEDQPILVITLGTLFGTPSLYRRAIETAFEADIDDKTQVVAVTSHNLEIDHQRLTKAAWVSMDRLLDKATAVVHHGGWGSTIAALATGTPAVVMPLAVDQRYQASRIHSVGAGVMISSDHLEEELQHGIEKVIGNPTYTANALRLQMEIDQMPPASEVVPLIEQLATQGPPLLNH